MKKILISMTLAMTALLALSGCVVSEKAAGRQARVQAAVAEAVANRRLHIDILSMLTASTATVSCRLTETLFNHKNIERKRE